MDQRTTDQLERLQPAPQGSRRVRARGTDVSFAMACDEALAESLDRAIERGVELLQAEQSERIEQRFYSGRVASGQARLGS